MGSTFLAFLERKRTIRRSKSELKAAEKIRDAQRGSVATAFKPQVRNKVVLLTEDDPSVRTVTAQMLRVLGFTVVETEDFDSAVRAHEEKSGAFSLVVLDYDLGNRTGSDLAEVLLTREPDLPIVLMTGFSLSSVDVRDELRERLRFIEKPFTLVALKVIVDSVC